MKKFLLFFVFCLPTLLLCAQNPFAKYGSKVKVVTMTNGKYSEFHDLEDIVTIGEVRFDTRTNKVVGFTKPDTATINKEVQTPSMFLSVDPHAERYYSISPYAYCSNNPVIHIDPRGKDIYNINQNTGQIEIIKTKNKTHSYYIVDGDGNKSFVGSFAYNKKGLVQLPKSLKFNNLQGNNVGFSVKNGSESKSFVSGNAMASLIGTVANANVKDLTVNQFSNADGSSPAPSISHKNGTNGDLRYLRTDASGGSVLLGSPNVDVSRQNTLNDALNLFGWKDMISERFNGGQLLDHTSSAQERGISSDHTTHLHLQGYSPNITTTYMGEELDEVEVKPNN